MNNVLDRSVSNHAKYVGLAIAIRNFNKVWGVTSGSFNEDGTRNGYESSVQKAVKEKWGENGYRYIEKLLADLQGAGRSQSSFAAALSKVRGNYAKAVLTLNASVTVKQAASYPTAGAVVGFKPLLRALLDTSRVDLNLIAKYTPLLWYRSQGFSTQELGDLKKSGRELPKMLNWVQGVDILTTRKLWKAAEYYVRSTDKSLTAGSDSYYKAVAEVYNRIIEETQPNYTTMQRPQLLRTDDTLMQNIAMFKTQPFQNFNILYDATANYIAKKKAHTNSGTEESLSNYHSAKKQFGWAVTSQIMQSAVFSAMAFAWAMFRGKAGKYEDDEEKEVTLLSALSQIGRDMAGSAVSGVPFGSDVWEMAGSIAFREPYYGFDSVTVSAIDDLFNAFKKAGNSVSSLISDIQNPDQDVAWNEQRHNADSIIDAASKVFGRDL